MWECNCVNEVVLTYISALVVFLREIRTLVHEYEQNKEVNMSFFSRTTPYFKVFSLFYGSFEGENNADNQAMSLSFPLNTISSYHV